MVASEPVMSICDECAKELPLHLLHTCEVCGMVCCEQCIGECDHDCGDDLDET